MIQENQEQGDKKMNEKEEIEEAKNIRYIIHEKELYSEERANEASIEFSRLEIQIAVLLLGVIGAFVKLYLDSMGSNSIKVAIISALLLLVGSLVLGLLHLKRSEKFWDDVSLTRELRYSNWQKVIRGDTSYKEAIAFHEGTKVGGGPMISVPTWIWILQSVLLGIAVFIILVLAVKFIVAT